VEGTDLSRLKTAATVGGVEGRKTSKATSLLSRRSDFLDSLCDQERLVDFNQVPAVDGDHSKRVRRVGSELPLHLRPAALGRAGREGALAVAEDEDRQVVEPARSA
jgi:hypothetical protein